MRLQLSGPSPIPMAIHPPALTPDDDDAWRASLLGSQRAVMEKSHTALGWPVTIAFARVDGATSEYRAVAMFRFFHLSAAAVVRSDDRDVLVAMLPALVEIWQTAKPDFDDDVVTLAQLFERK